MAASHAICQVPGSAILGSFSICSSLLRLKREMTPESLQGSWVVASYRSDDEMVIPDDRSEASLTIDGALVFGNMGVNGFSGQIDSELPIGSLAMTRMAGPVELMRQEDIILEHIQEADAIEVVEDGMSMSRDGLLLIELERTGTAESGRSS